MTCGRVTVEVERSSGFKHPMDFSDSQSNTNKISQQASFLKYRVKSFDEIDSLNREYSTIICQYLSEPRVGLLIPNPGIGECLSLCPIFVSDVVVDLVVVAFGVEGWINVTQVDGFIGNIFAKNFEVVGVVESVHWSP